MVILMAAKTGSGIIQVNQPVLIIGKELHNTLSLTLS
jgi:hypothetical protein